MESLLQVFDVLVHYFDMSQIADVLEDLEAQGNAAIKEVPFITQTFVNTQYHELFRKEPAAHSAFKIILYQILKVRF